jgi:hypothetical protein
MPDSVVVCPPPARVRIAGRSFVPGTDRGVASGDGWLASRSGLERAFSPESRICVVGRETCTVLGRWVASIIPDYDKRREGLGKCRTSPNPAIPLNDLPGSVARLVRHIRPPGANGRALRSSMHAVQRPSQILCDRNSVRYYHNSSWSYADL